MLLIKNTIKPQKYKFAIVFLDYYPLEDLFLLLEYSFILITSTEILLPIQ